ANKINPFEPWLSQDAADLDRRTVEAEIHALAAADTPARLALELLIDNDNGAPMKDQSYLGLLTLIRAGRMGNTEKGRRGYWELTETHRCARGNQALADRLADAIGSGLNLRTPVTSITMLNDGVQVTAGGATTDYDYAVLAVPPSMWGHIAVNPPFDSVKYAISHGPAVKYLTRYPTAFWAADHLAPSAKWDRLGSVWEATDQQDKTQAGFSLAAYSAGSYVLDSADKYRERISELYPPGPGSGDAWLVDWPNTPWIMTGVSVPAPGEVTTIARNLSEPYLARLHFAGEQACVGFFGYMEGALRSGARAARDIIRQQLPQAAPRPMPIATPVSFQAYAPLGLPAGADVADQRAHAETLNRRLTVDPTPFAGDRVAQRYTLDAPDGLGDELRELVAIWSGFPQLTTDQHVAIRLDAALALQLRDLIGVPYPTLATYGPIALGALGSSDRVVGGQRLGRMAGPHFEVTLQDEHDCYLDPLAVFERFERAGLWAGSGGARNPLLLSADFDRPLDVAGPNPVPAGRPFLRLRGGWRGATMHNPPDPLPTDYLSFLSTDAVTIGVGNLGTAGVLTIEDITEPMYRTVATNPITVTINGDHEFVAKTALPPRGTSSGKRDPGVPLTYRIIVELPNDPQPLMTTITQDTRDIIRQEYVFHDLLVPHRELRAGPPTGLCRALRS
ncbi:MAG: FAD-dependent oxidoreductase, partial [Acidimicrobiales bacterium]